MMKFSSDVITSGELIKRKKWAIWEPRKSSDYIILRVYDPELEQIHTLYGYHFSHRLEGLIHKLPLMVREELLKYTATFYISSSFEVSVVNFEHRGVKFLEEEVKITIKKKNYIIK